MSHLFLFGTLLDAPLRRIVAGCDLAGPAAVLADHAIRRAAAGDYPVLCPDPGADAPGLLLRDVPDAARARLDFYEQGFGYGTATVQVQAEGAPVAATVYVAGAPDPATDEPWALAPWQARWGDLTRTAATEAMAHFGRIDGAALARAMPTIRIRADAALRARADKPRQTWHDPALARGDVTALALRRPYLNYFAVAEHDLTHTRFDGSESDRMTRGGFLMGDAVTVLPYDPVRDRVLLVEQFRYGQYLRGDPVPWGLEPVAGRIDPGETPEDAARREAVEEAGLALHRLIRLAQHYPSPAAVTEYLYSYVGLCDLPDLARGHGGLASEHEDIRTHVMPFDDLLALADGNQLENTPLLLSVHWLARARARPGAFA